MFYLDIVLKSIGILFLITFMIILIWGFVIFNGIYSQMRYTNYLLEKISHILNIQDRNRQFNNKSSKSKMDSTLDTELDLDNDEIPTTNISNSNNDN